MPKILKSIKLSILISALAIACYSCKSAKKEPLKNTDGIEGVFIGNLPCNDCAAVRTVVKLTSPDRIEIESLFVGKSDSMFSFSGKFTYNKENNRLIYKDKGKINQFVWGDNKITQLDQNGNRITGKFADKYILTRDTINLFRYWKLVKLNDRSIENNQNTELHIQIRPKKNQFSGFSGCNRFNGTFSVYGNVLKFSEIGSTKKACPNPNPEAEFFKALNEVHYYSIEKEWLTLSSQERKVLLEFQVNYLK